jgi:hypothetical protein
MSRSCTVVYDARQPEQEGMVRTAIELILVWSPDVAWPAGLRPVVLDVNGRTMRRSAMLRWLAEHPLEGKDVHIPDVAAKRGGQ